MEVEIRIDPTLEQPKLVIHAPQETPELRQLADQLSALSLGPLQVWEEERSYLIQQSDFLRFYTQGKGVCAQTAEKTYTVRLRLYELEQLLPASFIRINKSTLANQVQLDRFAVTYSGAVDAVFKCGYREYVSRRCFAQIKRRFESK